MAADLVHQAFAVTPARDRQRSPHLLAVTLEQFQALVLASAGPHQLRVPLHVTDRHAGLAELGDEGEPVKVRVSEPAVSVAAPGDRADEADALVPAQRVRRQAALLRGLPDAPGRHGTEPMS